jgi:molybdopterin-biosynthesis enzyme MoeA-like protein
MSKAADELSKLLPSAKQVMEQLALTEAEKASEAMRLKAKADAEKRALIDRLTKSSGVSEEERLKRAATIIQRAVKNGLIEVEVTRFPNTLCTDRGRAINNGLEPGWEKTLTGLPKELYEFWERQLKPRGYKIKFQVVDFSGGVPGDIGITLKWG